MDLQRPLAEEEELGWSIQVCASHGCLSFDMIGFFFFFLFFFLVDVIGSLPKKLAKGQEVARSCGQNLMAMKL